MGHFCKSGWFYLRKSNTNNKCVILDGKFVFAIVYERPRADPLSLDDCADFILYSHFLIIYVLQLWLLVSMQNVSKNLFHFCL